MREKIQLVIVHLLIILGLFLVFTGLAIPEVPIDIKQTSFTESEPINTEDIKEYTEQFNEYEPVLPGEQDDLIDTYNISEFSNETQSDLQKLIDNESDSIKSTELYEGQFMVHFENGNTFLFEGEQNNIDPVTISLWGYLLIILAAIIFIRIPRNDKENTNEVSSLLDDVKVADEDSEWDYVIVDDEEEKVS